MQVPITEKVGRTHWEENSLVTRQNKTHIARDFALQFTTGSTKEDNESKKSCEQ